MDMGQAQDIPFTTKTHRWQPSNTHHDDQKLKHDNDADIKLNPDVVIQKVSTEMILAMF